jgi:hypothetical protein
LQDKEIAMKRSCALAIVVGFFATIVALNWATAPTYAQGCAYGTITDQVGTLDAGKICDNMKPWSLKGIRVFVHFVDKSFNTDGEFTDYANINETRLGERNPQGLRTDTMWLYATKDGKWVKSRLGDKVPLAVQPATLSGFVKNAIGNNDPTAGFVTALKEGFSVGFPDSLNQLPTPIRTPTQILTPTPTRPTPTPGPTATPTPIPTPTATPIPFGETPLGRTAGSFGPPIFALLCLGFLAIVIGVPSYRAYEKYARKLDHLRTIKSRVARLLNAVSQLLKGENVDSTLLYSLLKGYGIGQYKDMDKDVREWLRRCITALNEALQLNLAISQGKMSIDDQIARLEALYLTLTGTSDTILEMTDQQLTSLLDPTADVSETEVDVKLVQQIRALNESLHSGGLKISVTAVDQSKFDEKGILGYVLMVKQELAELRRAKDEAGPTVDKTKGARDQASHGPFPRG